MLTDNEIETLRRWSRDPSIFSAALVSHRELLWRAAQDLTTKARALAEADSRIENLNSRLEQGRRAYQVALNALAEREAECERWKQAALNVGRDAASAQTERDTLRAQLLESQQDLREEEKRHRKAAVDRDEFAAKLHLADQDRQILSDCRAALHDQLAERDAEIARLRAEQHETIALLRREAGLD